MKRAFWAVPLLALSLAVWIARGSYSYFLSQPLYPAGWPGWTTYGTVDSSCYGSYCGADGGGLAEYWAYPNEIKLTIRRDPASNDSFRVYFAGSNQTITSFQYDPYIGFYSFTAPRSYYAGFELVCRGSTADGHLTQATYDPNNGYQVTGLADGLTGGAVCSDSMTLRVVVRGAQVFVYVNNVLALNYTGIPSQGVTEPYTGVGLPFATGSRITNVDLGSLDSISPNAIPSSSIGKSAFVNHVDLSWPAGTDDVNGTGVYNYEVWRNGGFLTSTTGLTFSDTTVNPSTTYTYTLKVNDFHGNSASTNFNVTMTCPPIPSNIVTEFKVDSIRRFAFI